jgi:hypothetical protein
LCTRRHCAVASAGDTDNKAVLSTIAEPIRIADFRLVIYPTSACPIPPPVCHLS